jgi:hypothetical protein
LEVKVMSLLIRRFDSSTSSKYIYQLIKKQNMRKARVMRQGVARQPVDVFPRRVIADIEVAIILKHNPYAYHARIALTNIFLN